MKDVLFSLRLEPIAYRLSYRLFLLLMKKMSKLGIKKRKRTRMARVASFTEAIQKSSGAASSYYMLWTIRHEADNPVGCTQLL